MSNPSRQDLMNKVNSDCEAIALIYSPIELNEYIVEILSNKSDIFIHKNHAISHFHSVDDAITQAKKYGAKEFFLCVDNTYDECGGTVSPQPFDYIPIHSKHKQTNN